MRMYALLRGDIEMTPGKACSQAGHAYKMLTRQTVKNFPELDQEYFADDDIGTNVTLIVPDISDLVKIWDDIRNLNCPKTIIEDSGHIHPPHFNGEPIVTCIGIGPVYRDELPASIKNLQKY